MKTKSVALCSFLTLVFVLATTSNAFAAATDFPIKVAGQSWSRDLGLFTNGCIEVGTEGPNPNPRPDCSNRKSPSDAELACAQIGGRLPTRDDFEQLFAIIESESPGAVNRQRDTRYTYIRTAGAQMIERLFEEAAQPKSYWTSTQGYESWDEVKNSRVYVYSTASGYSRFGSDDYFGSLFSQSRGYALNTRCIEK